MRSGSSSCYHAAYTACDSCRAHAICDAMNAKGRENGQELNITYADPAAWYPLADPWRSIEAYVNVANQPDATTASFRAKHPNAPVGYNNIFIAKDGAVVLRYSRGLSADPSTTVATVATVATAGIEALI